MLSDLYAMGVVDCDNMLMLLGVCDKLSDKERDVVIPLIMKGFKASTVFVSLLQCVYLSFRVLHTVSVCVCLHVSVCLSVIVHACNYDKAEISEAILIGIYFICINLQAI